jgi:hypothetical protein
MPDPLDHHFRTLHVKWEPVVPRANPVMFRQVAAQWFGPAHLGPPLQAGDSADQPVLDSFRQGLELSGRSGLKAHRCHDSIMMF